MEENIHKLKFCNFMESIEILIDVKSRESQLHTEFSNSII